MVSGFHLENAQLGIWRRPKCIPTGSQTELSFRHWSRVLQTWFGQRLQLELELQRELDLSWPYGGVAD